MSAMRPYKADPRRRTWQLEFRDHRGRKRRLSSRTRDRATVLSVGHRIERLIGYRTRGEPVPADLVQWVHACHPAISDKLLAWGIVEGRKAQTGKPLVDHIEAWREFLQGKGRTERYVKQSAGRLSRLFADCGFEQCGDIEAEAVLKSLGELAPGRPWSPDV